MTYSDYIYILHNLTTRDTAMLVTGFVVGFWPTLSRLAFNLPKILREIF